MNMDHEAADRYPRAWGRGPVFVRIKATTFFIMLFGDFVALFFIMLVIMGV